MKNTYAVIMAGGVGSRFWPVSRAASPKQLLDLTGSGRTMIESTVSRLQPDIPPERVLVVTGAITRDAVASVLPDVPKENILAEPVGRNTAPCIGWAALHVKQMNPHGVMAVMPADHLVSDEETFRKSVRIAVEQAEKDALVTFGISPTRPETGFGYIEMGKEHSEDVRNVIRFVEKPDLDTALKYLSAGNFTWNSGMFFFKADRIIAEIERQIPALKMGLNEIEEGMRSSSEIEVVASVFPGLPSVSIDYGIMEGASGILCVPVDFGWSDLGSWDAAFDLSARDEQGNSFDGEIISVGAKRCMVRGSSDKLIAMVDVEDLVVIDTGDSLLVCKRESSQDVKKVTDALKNRKRNDLL